MKETKATILYAEDDEALSFLTIDSLGLQGFNLDHYVNGKDALSAFKKNKYDLCILDVMLPEMDGFELAERIRKLNSQIPILFLTAKSLKEDRLTGLRIGGDDYITKPFSQRLLGERIKAVLRRAKLTNIELPEPQEGDDKVIRRGKLLLDPNRHACSWDGNAVRLTVTEFLILESLAKRPGYVKSRDQLMDAAYDDQIYVDDRTIDSHIKRLRKKFRKTDKSFDGIETLYGVGYKYKEA